MTEVKELIKVMQEDVNYYKSEQDQTEDYKETKQGLKELLLKTNKEKYQEKVYVLESSKVSNVHATTNKILYTPMHKLVQEGIIDVVPRAECEYNLKYLQLVVGAIIVTADDHIVVLKTNENNRMKNCYTMIQGHASFSPSHMLGRFDRMLTSEMAKEMKEELSSEVDPTLQFITDNTTEVDLPFIIKTSDSAVSLEHVGYIYKIQLSMTSEELAKYKLTSGEDNKHTVEVISYDKLIGNDLGDKWLQESLETIFVDKIHKA